MRPPGTPEQLEARRRRAIRLLREGKGLSAVARAVGASLSSVQRWRWAYRAKGWKGLRPRRASGRPPKLSAPQKRKLEKMLLRGAPAAGFGTNLWTLPRVAQLIEREFAVRYHPGHVWRLLRALAWTCQKPERRALERDEDAIQRWGKRRWPHIKKRPQGGVQHRIH